MTSNKIHIIRRLMIITEIMGIRDIRAKTGAVKKFVQITEIIQQI